MSADELYNAIVSRKKRIKGMQTRDIPMTSPDVETVHLILTSFHNVIFFNFFP